MKHLTLFENYDEPLKVGSYTNLGYISDEYGNQYEINGTWYHKSLVNPAVDDRAPVTKLTSQPSSAKPAKKGGNLVVVDIQPEYQHVFGFELSELRSYLNSTKKSITFLYNGEDLGMNNETDYREWLRRVVKVKGSVLSRARFFEKGYAFFRSLIDCGYSQEECVQLAQYMLELDHTDSRDITEEQWVTYLERGGSEDVAQMLKKGEVFFIPPVMDELKALTGDIELIGGGENECLLEILIAFDAMEMDYELNRDFVY